MSSLPPVRIHLQATSLPIHLAVFQLLQHSVPRLRQHPFHVTSRSIYNYIILIMAECVPLPPVSGSGMSHHARPHLRVSSLEDHLPSPCPFWFWSASCLLFERACGFPSPPLGCLVRVNTFCIKQLSLLTFVLLLKLPLLPPSHVQDLLIHPVSRLTSFVKRVLAERVHCLPRLVLLHQV